jgi:hypothetical protein
MHDPQSLHKYLYTHGDPVNASDPTGLFSLSSSMVTAATYGFLGGVSGGTLYGVAKGYQQGLRGLELYNFAAKHAAFGGLVGATVGLFAAGAVSSLAFAAWSAGGVSATAATSAATFAVGFPLASAGFGLGLMQYKYGYDNRDPVDMTFGALGMAFSIFGMFKLSGSLPAATGSSIRRRSFANLAELNQAANNATPNTEYSFGSYKWLTDNLGRVVRVRGRAELGTAGRDATLQRAIGHEGVDTDVGFHLIADSLNGPTNRVNVVPGNGAPLGDGVPNLNQGAYASFERTVRGLLRRGDTVDIDIEAIYNSGNSTNRPDVFSVEFRVNGGNVVRQRFPNKQ